MCLAISTAATFRKFVWSLKAFTSAPARTHRNATSGRRAACARPTTARNPEEAVACRSGRLNPERWLPQSPLHWGGFRDNFLCYMRVLLSRVPSQTAVPFRSL